MARILLILPALIIGFILWSVTLLLSGGVAPLGKTGPMELLIFGAPIAGTIVPLGLQHIEKGAVATAAWMFALAPLAGALNFLLAVFVIGALWSSLSGASDTSFNIVIGLLNCLWFLPLVGMARSANKR